MWPFNKKEENEVSQLVNRLIRKMKSDPETWEFGQFSTDCYWCYYKPAGVYVGADDGVKGKLSGGKKNGGDIEISYSERRRLKLAIDELKAQQSLLKIDQSKEEKYPGPVKVNHHDTMRTSPI